MPDNLTEQYEADRHWKQSRRKASYQRLLCNLKHCSPDLLSFDHISDQLALRQRVYRGLQEVGLSEIRGSVGRHTDFTNEFYPLLDHLRRRWQRVRAYASCCGLPPITVYKVCDLYFVVDGHHRVSVTRESGYETIQAYVWEFILPKSLCFISDPESNPTPSFFEQ